MNILETNYFKYFGFRFSNFSIFLLIKSDKFVATEGVFTRFLRYMKLLVHLKNCAHYEAANQ